MSTVSTIESLFATLLTGDTSVIPALDAAILEGVSDAGKTVYALVMRRGYTRGGRVEPAKRVVGRYTVVVPGKTIRVVGLAYPAAGDIHGDRRPYDRVFALGDTVEYDSYNFAYHGTIKTIGCTIAVAKEGSTRSVRLDLETFTARNWDLDLAAAAARNSDVLMSC